MAKSPPTMFGLRQRSREIITLAAHFGASNVRVTGSVARGDADAGSDVDLIVDLAPDRDARDLSELRIELEMVLGRPIEVFVIVPQAHRSAGSHAARMLREALPLTGIPGVAGSESETERDRRRLQSLSGQLIQVFRDTESGEGSLDDHLVFDATAQRLRWIGHAASRLSDEAKSRHPSIRWKAIAGFPHVAEHSREVMWEIVQTHLPALREAVDQELRQYQSIQGQIPVLAPGDERGVIRE
jgi:uncharacterized protein